MRAVKSQTWRSLLVDEVRTYSFDQKSEQIQPDSHDSYRWRDQKTHRDDTSVERLNKLETEVRFASKTCTRQDDNLDASFYPNYRLHVKSMLRASETDVQRRCSIDDYLMYNVVLQSTITFDSSVWHASHEKSNFIPVMIKTLNDMQKHVLYLITEAFRVTSTLVLKIEINIASMKLYLT